MIDLVTAVAGIYADQPEATCNRCGNPFEGRSVVFVQQDPLAVPIGTVVIQLCVACFLEKFETWQKLADHLREATS